MLARMYISTRPLVIAFAQEKNTLSTPQISTQIKAIACVPTSRWIALTGVFRFGLTLPSGVGRTPERPMAYQVLVPPLKQAMATATAASSRPHSTQHQPPPPTPSALDF